MVNEAVSEQIDYAEIVRRWLALPEDKRWASPEEVRDRLAATPSPERQYQSAMEGVAVLNDHIDTQAQRAMWDEEEGN